MTSSTQSQFEIFIRDLDRECADMEAERWRRKRRKGRKKDNELPIDIRHGK